MIQWIKFCMVLLCFTTYHLCAQFPPWELKFIAYHPNGNTDSIWVGCDDEATVGYDLDFDIVDESLYTPIGIGIYNPVVESELGLSSCTNLERDIKPFDDIVTYEFFLLHSPISVIDTIYLGWDTSTLNYEQGDFKIEGAILFSSNGYIVGIDGTEYVFCSRSTDGEDFNINFQPIPIYVLGNMLSCSPIDTQLVIKLELAVYFKDYSVQLDEIESTAKVSIYPNPIVEKITIESDFHYNTLVRIYSVQGETILEQRIKPGRNIVSTSGIDKGLYVVIIYENNRIIYSYKLNKL